MTKSSDDAEFDKLLLSMDKIKAIGKYRLRKGCSLREAKNYVERLRGERQ